MFKLSLVLVFCAAVCNSVQAQRAQTVAKLMRAAQQGDVVVVRNLVKQLPMNSRDEHARTAVHYAVEHQQVDVLYALLCGGADPNIIDANGDTPYDLWEKHKNVDIARVLKREKAKSSAVIQQELLTQDRQAYTKRNTEALFKAAAAGDRNRIEQLLEAGVNPKIKNSDGLFPFHITVQNGHPAVAAILLRAMTNNINGIDDKSWTPLHWAILAKDWEMVRGLLREQANFRYNVPSSSRRYQDPYDVARYVHAGEQFLALIFAEQRHDIVKKLVEKAIRDDDTALIELLAKHGLDLQDDEDISDFALTTAVRHNKEAMIRFLMEHGLHADSLKGVLAKRTSVYQQSMLKVLLEYIKDRNEINAGFVAVYLVDRRSRKGSAKVLLEHGADPNATDDQGNPALITIVKKNPWQAKFARRHEDMEELLAHGADINATDANGKTALILLASKTVTNAEKKSYLEFVRLLLKNGADASISDNNNLTAKDYAEGRSDLHSEFLELLEQAESSQD